MPDKTRHIDLTKGAIGHHLITLTVPTIGEMMAIIIFNVTDTFFVSKLGTDALAAIFTEKPEVLKLTLLYIRIMAFSFLFCNILPWTTLKLNAVGKPLPAMLLNVLGIACIAIPCVIAGAWLYDFCGMLVGLIIGQLILSLIAALWGRYLLCPERAKKSVLN